MESTAAFLLAARSLRTSADTCLPNFFISLCFRLHRHGHVKPGIGLCVQTACRRQGSMRVEGTGQRNTSH
jgi:hypothetical protein